MFDTLAGPASGATSAPSKVSGTPSLGFGGTSMKARSFGKEILSQNSIVRYRGKLLSSMHAALFWF